MIGEQVLIKRSLFDQDHMDTHNAVNVGDNLQPKWLPVGKVKEYLGNNEFICQVSYHELIISRKEMVAPGETFIPKVRKPKSKYRK